VYAYYTYVYIGQFPHEISKAHKHAQLADALLKAYRREV
jgi:hypothetical protein